MEERKGFLTPEQEEKLHSLLKLKGILGVIDAPVLRILDNIGLEKLKAKLGPGGDEILKVIFTIIDEVFAALPDAA